MNAIPMTEFADLKELDKDALYEVARELDAARRGHADMHSPHEGFAVLKEEVDELWEEVRRRNRSPRALREEALQVAAMAVRFLVDTVVEPTQRYELTDAGKAALEGLDA